jgi:hypothetical protein
MIERSNGNNNQVNSLATRASGLREPRDGLAGTVVEHLITVDYIVALVFHGDPIPQHFA